MDRKKKLYQSSAFCFYLSRELWDHYYGEMWSVVAIAYMDGWYGRYKS